MTPLRILAALAVLVTVLQLAFVGSVSASFLTVDGNTLRIIAAVVGLLVAILLPVGLGWSAVRALASRGREVKRGRTIAGIVTFVNLVGLGLGLWLLPGATARIATGTTALLGTASAETIQGEATGAEGTTDKEIQAPPPKGAENVVAAQAAVTAALEGSGIQAADALTNESAAAIGAMWMRFLSETYGDELRRKAGDEAWQAVHAGLPVQGDLWRDPAALEAALTKDGRGFLRKVALLADAAVPGEGAASLVAPVLPEKILQRIVLEGDGLASSARYREVALNRVEVELPGAVLDVRFEDRGWRVHLGDYGDLANRKPSPQALLIALRP